MGTCTLVRVFSNEYVLLMEFLGEWADNVPHGRGRYEYHDESYFEGEFDHGSQSGKV